MRRLILATALIALLGVAGCSSDSSSSSSEATTTLAPGASSSAEDAVLAYINAASRDQWGRVWDGLHPDQKALFTRETFMQCSSAPPFTIDDVEVIETFKEDTSLPGVSDSVASTAVTVRITVSSGGEKDTQTLTAHAYEVEGQWWTSVSPDVVAACA